MGLVLAFEVNQPVSLVCVCVCVCVCVRECIYFAEY